MKNKHYTIVVSSEEDMLYIVEKKNAVRVAELLVELSHGGIHSETWKDMQDELEYMTKLCIPFDMQSENPNNIIIPLTFTNPRKM